MWASEGEALVNFVILGPTQLLVNGKTVNLGSAKQRGLLALLLYYVGRPVSVDMIVDEIWTGKPFEAVRNSLYQLVSRIRTVLKRAGVPGALSGYGGSYTLRVDADLVDFHRFDRYVQQANHAAAAGEHREAARLLGDAIGLWQGTPLADLRGEWATHRRGHMVDTVWLGAHKRLFDNLLVLGEHHTVLTRLGPLLEEYELDETLARQWILALDGAGRYPDASSFYLDFRRRWLGELGSEPAREVHDAYSQVLSRRRPIEPSNVAATNVTTADVEFSPPHQLPRDIGDFTGHEALLARLDAKAGVTGTTGGVVVIDGMPGVGKTTLAIHWAHRCRKLFPDGQVFLDACSYGPDPPLEPRDALGRLLNAIGVPADRIPPGEHDRRERLSRLLDGRRLLIVLDNVADAKQVRPVLSATSNCTMLITSRTRLKGLAIREAVHTITVPPLNRQESVSLLRGILSERPDDEHEELAALADLSSGLPLALRVVGQHASERPRAHLADLVEQLRHQLLAEDTDVGNEDATVHTVFDFSYRALPCKTGRLFRLLSLHPGRTVSVEAASALSDADVRRTEQALDALAAANLLQHDAARRYHLHDLLRCFANDRVHREEPAAQTRGAIQRMLDWYLLTATNAVVRLAPHRARVPDLPDTANIKPMTFKKDTDAMRWCIDERANLAAITRYAAQQQFHNHAWQIPGEVHEIFQRYGSQDDVLECHEIALASAKTAGHHEGQLGTLNNLGTTYHRLRDYPSAAACFEEGIRLARSLGHQEGEAPLTHNLANVLVKEDKFEAAIGLYQQARRTAQKIGNKAGEATALHRLGKAYHRMGRPDEAFDCYRLSLTMREQIGHQRGEGATHAALAALHRGRNEHTLALEHAQLALAISANTKDQAITCDALISRSVVRRQLEQFEQAVHDARRALDICDDTLDSRRRTHALHALGEALAAAGDTDRARRAWSEELRILEDFSDPKAHDLRTQISSLD